MRYHFGVVALALCVALATGVPPQQPALPAADSTTAQPPAPEECTLGEKKGKVENCRDYFECVDNAWVEKSCYWFWKFDSVSKSCKLWGATCSTN